MLQTRFTGKDATAFLESVVVADLAELDQGASTLSLFTNDKGGIIDDTVINKHSNGNGYYVVSNAGCSEKDLAHLKSKLAEFGGDVKMQVLDLSLVALQGIVWIIKRRRRRMDDVPLFVLFGKIGGDFDKWKRY